MDRLTERSFIYRHLFWKQPFKCLNLPIFLHKPVLFCQAAGHHHWGWSSSSGGSCISCSRFFRLLIRRWLGCTGFFRCCTAPCRRGPHSRRGGADAGCGTPSPCTPHGSIWRGVTFKYTVTNDMHYNFIPCEEGLHWNIRLDMTYAGNMFWQGKYINPRHPIPNM